MDNEGEWNTHQNNTTPYQHKNTWDTLSVQRESAETVAPNCDGIYQNVFCFAFQLKLRGKKSSVFFLSVCLQFSYFITSEIGSAQAQYCTITFFNLHSLNPHKMVKYILKLFCFRQTQYCSHYNHKIFEQIFVIYSFLNRYKSRFLTIPSLVTEHQWNYFSCLSR